MSPTITGRLDRSLSAEPGQQAVRRRITFWLLMRVFTAIMLGTTRPPPRDQRPSACYQIRVRGHLGAAMRRAFPDLHATAHGHDMLLEGIADQAALHGVLARIEELGLELLEVHRTDREHTPEQGGLPRWPLPSLGRTGQEIGPRYFTRSV